MIAVLLKGNKYYFADMGEHVLPLGTVEAAHAAAILKAVGPFMPYGRSRHGPIRFPLHEMVNADNPNRVRLIQLHPERFRCVSYA